jgi:hypothetical protein
VSDYKQTLIHREASKAGFRGKVNAKCIECVYDPMEPGTWRKQTENCPSVGCSLYAVRPTSSGGDEATEGEG